MKITEQQIKDCYENKELLKEYFPDVFKPILEVGKWYKGLNRAIAFYDKKGQNYGLSNGYGIDDNGDWCSGTHWTFEIFPKYWIKATKEEVEKALISEAEKIGFTKGVILAPKGINNFMEFQQGGICGEFKYIESRNILECTRGRGHIFHNGKWAEIIQETEIELTLDQIAEKFGVDKVKIKKE